MQRKLSWGDTEGSLRCVCMRDGREICKICVKCRVAFYKYFYSKTKLELSWFKYVFKSCWNRWNFPCLITMGYKFNRISKIFITFLAMGYNPAWEDFNVVFHSKANNMEAKLFRPVILTFFRFERRGCFTTSWWTGRWPLLINLSQTRKDKLSMVALFCLSLWIMCIWQTLFLIVEKIILTGREVS